MNKKIISIVIASALLAGTAQHAQANDQNASNSKQKQYIGTGIGATAGALFAGPVGFIVGGVIGNLAAKHDAKDDHASAHTPVEDKVNDKTESQPLTAPVIEDEIAANSVVAQAGEIEPLNKQSSALESELKDILIENMGLDVFFLSGSTTLEDFYKPRLQAVTKIMQQIPGIDIQLEGYSDRRGDKDSNLALSNERLESVRNALVQAGIDASRIKMNAFGEQQFTSRAGELEAYTFDRRVVLRFEQATPESKSPVALLESEAEL